MARARIIFGGSEREVQLISPGVTVFGRSQAADVPMDLPFLSRKHFAIGADGEYYVEDMESRNGTFLNGNKVNKAPLSHGDRIEVGELTVIFEMEGQPKPAAVPAQIVEEDLEVEVERAEGEFPSQMIVGLPEQLGKDPIIELKSKVHDLLVERMDLRRLDVVRTEEKELREKTRNVVEGILSDLDEEIPYGTDMNRLIKEILDEALALGPLEDLLAMSDITEIMVNRWDRVYVERKGKLQLTDKKFVNNEQIVTIIQRIVAPLGRRIDEGSPMVDARLKDGSRVNAIIPPLALQGPTLTIRKFSKQALTAEDLVQYKSVSREIVEFLMLCVKQRKNIVISGGTGSGKTTFLNLLSGFIPVDERIVTVEDAAELRLPQDHVVSLEARPPNIEGKGAVHIRDLVKNCLRMRPDRIVVGECRGGEALDMLQAMNTGHDGSLTTGHANTPRDLLSRLETMVLMSGMDLPVRAIREQIAAAVDFVVQQARMADGTRKITHVTEVTGMEGEVITMQDIFLFKQEGFDENNKIRGQFVSTGNVPKLADEMRAKGLDFPLGLFQKKT